MIAEFDIEKNPREKLAPYVIFVTNLLKWYIFFVFTKIFIEKRPQSTELPIYLNQGLHKTLRARRNRCLVYTYVHIVHILLSW